MSPPATKLHWSKDRTPREGFTLLDRLDPNLSDERAALCAGLFARPASIAPKYFYDAIGCALFEAICVLPEYYPTRTERGILDEQRDDIAAVAGRHKQLVDLGAGDCAKAAMLLPALQPRRYVAVDIAAAAIAPALAQLAPVHPGVEMIGVVTDFSRRLDLGDAIDAGPVTFFFHGSSIGNCAPLQALDLLKRIRHLCTAGSGLLIGVDTKKDRLRLAAAYDDAVGVTAAFNRNILRHVNAVAQGNFDPAAFAHVAFYNDALGRIEMHLEARSRQVVQTAFGERVFAAGERIHTESSYKYAPTEFGTLLRQAGFADVAVWQDANEDFAVYYAE
ncbi:MAG: L-histidine N(alpha)-methyltransferase [Casimicrobiaceae bacterium]